MPSIWYIYGFCLYSLRENHKTRGRNVNNGGNFLVRNKGSINSSFWNSSTIVVFVCLSALQSGGCIIYQWCPSKGHMKGCAGSDGYIVPNGHISFGTWRQQTWALQARVRAPAVVCFVRVHVLYVIYGLALCNWSRFECGIVFFILPTLNRCSRWRIFFLFLFLKIPLTPPCLHTTLRESPGL